MFQKRRQPEHRTAGMIRIEGGTFTMGSLAFYPEEAPLTRVSLGSFWIDETPVTNRQFAAFVESTGYVTMAEVAPDPRDYPGMSPAMAHPGSLVFHPQDHPADLTSVITWWSFEPGADWRHPRGQHSNLEGLGDHPVVHIAHADAKAYARWSGKQLPSEAEFEFAARGGLDGADYAWGDELAPSGQVPANVWQGLFPNRAAKDAHWTGTSPVKAYPPNGYGLYDIIGNVWEWTNDWWSERRPAKEAGSIACCTVANPRGGVLRHSFDPAQPLVRIGRKVLKGGSHLCAENYCRRYRPAARHPETIDTSTSHIGFRCVLREHQ